jgi:CRP-like cAMP-binding protein
MKMKSKTPRSDAPGNPFSALTAAELAALERDTRDQKFAKGRALFRSGEAVRGIFWIKRGAVKVLQETSPGCEAALRFAGAGDLVGHRSVFTRDTYRGSAIAREETTARLVTTELVQELFFQNRDFADLLIRLIARDLEQTERKLLELQRLNVPSRLISLFRILDEKFGVAAGGARLLDLAITKVEISELIGASPEVVIRQLSKWKREKLVSEESGKRLVFSKQLLGRIIRKS